MLWGREIKWRSVTVVVSKRRGGCEVFGVAVRPPEPMQLGLVVGSCVELCNTPDSASLASFLPGVWWMPAQKVV